MVRKPQLVAIAYQHTSNDKASQAFNQLRLRPAKPENTQSLS